jgi:hypothetical protein
LVPLAQTPRQDARRLGIDRLESFLESFLPDKNREKMFSEILHEKPSLFSTHPTISERIRAVDLFPDGSQEETKPALDLFDDPSAIERELTKYMTGYVYAVQPIQPQAELAVADPKVADRPIDRENPECVLEAAAMLDQYGEWDQALELYHHAAQAWPMEHGEYAQNCIRRIQIKKEQAGLDQS